jgi:hypothetical protein
MNKSESIAHLCAAMSKAFPEIEGAVKDKTNPHFRSKYADLGNVVDAVKPALLKHGLWFSQVSHDIEGHAAVETVIYHSSGEFLSCGIVSVPVSKVDAQGYGSAMTYARRYSLSAAFGVAPEDDDGNAAAKASPKRLDDQAVADNLAKIAESASMDDLKNAHAAAYKAAQAVGDSEAIKRFTAAKDKRKSEIEAGK